MYNKQLPGDVDDLIQEWSRGKMRQAEV